jgi:adenosine deaminase CECR1
MSNRLYHRDYVGYYLAKGDLSDKGKREWAYNDLPQEVCTLTKEERELEEYMEEKRGLLVGCSLRCPYQRPVFPPSESFASQKRVILQDDLFIRVFQKMPKGGLLHVHGAAALSAEQLIKLMLWWNRKIQDDNRRIRIVVQKIPGLQHRYALGTLLYEYQCGEILEYTELLHNYLKKGKKWKQLLKYLSFSAQRGQNTLDIWEKYNIIVSRTCELMKDRIFYTCYYMRFFEECIKDHIRYVEMRCDFENFVDPGEENESNRCERYVVTRALHFKDMGTEVNPVQPDAEFLDAILEALRLVRQKFRDAVFDVKIILNVQRSLNPYVKKERECICKRIDAAIALKEYYLKRGKEVVIGFDFAGMEDGSCRTDHYAKKIIYRPVGYGYEAKEKNTDEELRIEKIDFFLHAGESNWTFNDNLKAAAIISKYRIGHGINLNRTPEVLQGIVEGPKKILVEPVLEVCPIFDQLFGYCEDLRSHPVYEYMKNGIMCVIANDCPQILGNPGLSFDLWEAYVGMGLTLQMLKTMLFVSYLFEFTTYHNQSVDVEAAKREFLVDWKKFMEEMKKII